MIKIYFAFCTVLHTYVPEIPCDPSTTPSTLEVGDATNSTIPEGDVTGCLKSRNYPSNYDSSLFDEVLLHTNGRATLHIVIEHLEVCYV